MIVPFDESSQIMHICRGHFGCKARASMRDVPGDRLD